MLTAGLLALPRLSVTGSFGARRKCGGTKQRLVFDIYLYVGLRRGDAARLGKQHVRRGIIHLMTEKSQGKMPIYVPVHPALAKSIKACPSRGAGDRRQGRWH